VNKENRDSDTGLSPSTIEMMRIVSLDEAARLAGVARVTLYRHHAAKFVRLSKRRVGMRVRDALMIAKKTESDDAAD
jgi:hypothetical protein